jgi:hypothetical protein
MKIFGRLILGICFYSALCMSANAAGNDINDCVKRAGVDSYNYGLKDRFGRIGPYQLTVKDLFTAGACTGEGLLYGVVNDWKLCDFKGLPATDNFVKDDRQLSISAEVQDMYFSFIVSSLHKKYFGLEAAKLKNIDRYKSYPNWEKMVVAAIYRKGYKAVQFYSLFNEDVSDKKAKSFYEQMEIIKKCQIKKNMFQSKVKGRDWVNLSLVPATAQVQSFNWKDPDEKVKDLIDDFVFKNTKIKNQMGSAMLSTSKDSAYMYDKVDINLNKIDDYVLMLLGDKFHYRNMQYYVVFYDNGEEVKVFPANSIKYSDDRLIVNGYIPNE